VVTLYNEKNSTIRNKARGKWHELFRRGTCCITGFGYFAERAEVDGFPYYNISLSGKGDKYPDPKSEFFASENHYLLLTVAAHGPMSIEVKSLSGAVLDRRP
jgi:hypothetical protein